MVAHTGEGLRILLKLDPSAKISGLPWEFLYDAEHSRFFAHSRRTPLVRYLKLGHRPHPLTVRAPLRVLVMIASPAGLPSLDVEREWHQVNTALSGLPARGQVSVERLERADPHDRHPQPHHRPGPRPHRGRPLLRRRHGAGAAPPDGGGGHFAPVRVNEQLTLDFMTAEAAEGHHLAFDVDPGALDQILGRLHTLGVPYGNDPSAPGNGRVDHPLCARGLYFTDDAGNLYEVMSPR